MKQNGVSKTSTAWKGVDELRMEDQLVYEEENQQYKESDLNNYRREEVNQDLYSANYGPDG